jgi:YggT family protein
LIVDVVLLFIQILTIAIIARIAVSWVVLIFSSMRWLLYHPVVQALDAITDPILAPIRSVMPNLGGFDFSPMIAIILLQVIGQIVADAAV